MKTKDLISTAVSNTFRSKTRTILTILAIFVGAFTLTLTSGLGTGINLYIDSTVNSIGASDVMTVTRTADSSSGTNGTSGPAEYHPDSVAITGPGAAPGATVVALTPSDLDTLKSIPGVRSAQATKSISLDYIQRGNGTKYVANIGDLVPGQKVQLAAGANADSSSSAFQLVLPTSFVEPLGFAKSNDVVGKTVTLAITDGARTQHLFDASIAGITDTSIIGAPGGPRIIPNTALTEALVKAQNVGVPTEQQDRYAQASIRFDRDASASDVAALKSRLSDAGYTGQTLADQLGTVKTVINGIVLVLNAFAIIALLAASFGIINTLYMSVQERTREIGLMKAMGMGSGRVFSLFSFEAIFIGFLGSAIGALVAIAVGSALSSTLTGSVFSNLRGLTLIAFNPVSVAEIILVVMGIAFVSGTLPAARAAKADPVTSLRYE